MERPMHIGRLSAKLTPGVFVVEDLLIEGLTPTDRPFLKAKKIEVKLPWWTAFSRKLIIESVTLTDWEMVVESWPGGRHSFPKIMPKNRRTGPSRFTTTLRYVLATRGQFTYDDHATPWSSVARNLTLQLHRSDVTNDYRGTVSITNGTVQIQAYQPFRIDMQSRFSLNGGKVHFDRMDLTSDGARTVAHRRCRSRTLARTALPAPIAHRLPDAERDLLSRPEVRRLGRRRLYRDVSPLQGRARAEGLVRQRRCGRQRLAVPEPARVRALAAGSTRDHECHERALRRHGALRLPDGAVRPADASARDLGCRVQGCRSHTAHGFSGNRRAATVGPRVRPEPPRMAAREMGAEDGAGRGHDRAAAGGSTDDARAAGRFRRRARRASG